MNTGARMVVHFRRADGTRTRSPDGDTSSGRPTWAPRTRADARGDAFWGTYPIVTVGSAMGLGLKPFHAA